MTPGGEMTMGSDGLLRVAGLPIRYWLEGANPALFTAVERLSSWETRYREQAGQLAERIGEELVPDSALSRDGRGILLAVRRRLHAGEPIGSRLQGRMTAVFGDLPAADQSLIAEVVSVCDQGRALARSWEEVSAAAVSEQQRLRKLPTEFQRSALGSSYLQTSGDCTSSSLRTAGKQRRSFERAWRLIARATTVSTPREWFSHVALLEIRPVRRTSALAVSATYAAHWMESVRARRRALAAPVGNWPQADSWLAVNPLHWDEDENLVAIVLDHHEQPSEVVVKRTDLLEAVCAALVSGPRTCAEIQQALDDFHDDDRGALAGFIRYLVELGIVQPVAQSAKTLLDRRAKPGERFAHVTAGERAHAGWVDVYRRANSALALDACLDLQERALQTLRLLQVPRSDAEPPPVMIDSQRSWTVTEILRAELRSREVKGSNEVKTDHQAELVAGWPLTRAVELLEGRTGRSATVDIEPDLLDMLGVSDVALNWPVDCLLRLPAPEAEFTAVLAEFWPSGRGDARFAEALANLHGGVPQVDAYRSFLHELQALTGILFVELLAPPLADAAANAVRRPAYTDAWTGDPDARAYLPRNAKPGRYIPLQEISIRRSNGRLRAEANGQLLWPVYHATRSFSPPWDRLARILLAAAPFDSTVAYGRFDPFSLWPQRRHTPRITVGRTFVFAPARWKLSAGDCWDSSGSTVSKVRALLRLREGLSLPRWLELAQPAAKTTIACDLESLPGMRLLERCLSASGEITAVEMLPRPDQLLVGDLAHNNDDRLVSELLLRFPCDVTPVAMAARTASGILATAGSAESPWPASRQSACRGPPRRDQLRTARTAQEWERSLKHG